MLEVKNLVVFYGKNCALSDASLKVDGKSIVSLIGGNGAGKTTTLRSISGLVKSSSGAIEFEGIDIRNLPSREIVKLGIAHVPEGRRLFREMSVLENLLTGAQFPRSKRNFQRNLTRAFELFPLLEERQKQLAGTLSGGEGQMLAIARGLMSDPKLLLLDEPSFGLAPLVVKSLGETMVILNTRAGTTILLAEQNTYLALEVANRVFLLEVGRVILQGMASELRSEEMVVRAYLGG
jgi:branched-chain amino acid transport system ATP-binding protein